MLNRDIVARKGINETKKVRDTLDVNEDSFCEEKLVT